MAVRKVINEPLTRRELGPELTPAGRAQWTGCAQAALGVAQRNIRPSQVGLLGTVLGLADEEARQMVDEPHVAFPGTGSLGDCV